MKNEVNSDVPVLVVPYTFGLLHIFTAQGKTFTFRDGQVIADNESILNFIYNVASDGKGKLASFYKVNMVGHSVSP